ncbi:MAG: prolipoprotein diacylglyceryl transferase [Candidatus Hydrogenedentes bacterium]|nr:prolipoprotein diacylglyceryl transferase [Candidatus Hydrogenedentota bacterium]
MAFRIGSLVLYPQIVMIPLGAAFFLVIAYKRLAGPPARSRREAFTALLSSAVLAAAGSLIFSDHGDPQAMVGGQSSFTGYWGALIGVSLWALIARKPVMAAANSVAPAVMAGGAVARLGCVFAGCCRGVPSLPLFHVWPLYDIAALLAALMLGVRLEKRRAGGSLFAFLIVYGLLRFFLEFARDIPASALGLTAGQWFAAAQTAAGFALLVAGRAQSAAIENPDV